MRSRGSFCNRTRLILSRISSLEGLALFEFGFVGRCGTGTLPARKQSDTRQRRREEPGGVPHRPQNSRALATRQTAPATRALSLLLGQQLTFAHDEGRSAEHPLSASCPGDHLTPPQHASRATLGEGVARRDPDTIRLGYVDGDRGVDPTQSARRGQRSPKRGRSWCNRRPNRLRHRPTWGCWNSRRARRCSRRQCRCS